MKKANDFIMLALLVSTTAMSQPKTESIPLFGNKNLSLVNVKAAEDDYLGKKSLKVTDTGADTEAKFVKTDTYDFKNGIIEIELSGKPGESSSEQARGFVGIAFRIARDNSTFECIYLRPTNGRADDQVRRNHSVQYISFPDFPWFNLRKEFPEKYESYVDLVPGEWTKVRIEVKDDQAKLFVHGNPQPTLLVSDLKLGADQHGAVGLWIGPGTEAHFSNLRITKND